MPDKPEVHRRMRVSHRSGWQLSTGLGSLVALVTWLIASVAAPAAWSETGLPHSGAVSVRAVNFDLDAIVADLQGDHLAGVNPGAATYQVLTEQIVRSQSTSIDLNVVIAAGSFADTTNEDATAAILAVVGGTVLFLTPEDIVVQSRTISQGDLDKARESAQAAGDDTAAVRAFVDSLTASGFPWSLVVIALVIILLVAAISGGLWERKRRQQRNAAALATLTSQLHDQVGGFAPQILYLSERIDLVQDAELSARFSQSSADYNQLRDQLSMAPLSSRDQVDAFDRQVSELGATLSAIRVKVDADIDRLSAGPDQ